MSEFGQNLKDLVKKGIEVISSGAESLASSTKQKVAEFNLENEKEEILTGIGSKVFELWKNGDVFPDSLTDDLKKAAEKEEALKAVRGKEAPVPEGNQENAPAEKIYDDVPVSEPENAMQYSFSETAEYAAKDERDIPVIEVEKEDPENKEPEDLDRCPLSSAINDLFEKVPPVDKMVDRVNSSLDDLGESLRKFTGDFDRQLNEFTDQMMGKDDQNPKNNV